MNETIESTPIPRNAFAAEFLASLEAIDDFATAEEAEMAGPWKLAETPGGYALCEVWRDLLAGDVPFALFGDRDTALCFLAALSAAGRPALFQARPLPEGGEHAVASQGKVVGCLEHLPDRLLDFAHLAAHLARSPLALAWVLEASGPASLRRVGEILRRSLGR